MHPVRRGLRPLTITALATGLAFAGPATIAASPAAAAPKKAHSKKAKKSAPVRCHAGGQTARPGETLVVITTVRSADTGKVVERRSTAYTCSADGRWIELSSPTAGLDLIPTSIVIERTETTR